MAKLNWSASGERIYGTGVDRGVLYPSVGPGVAWDGLVSVKEITSDTDTRITYMDGHQLQTQVNLGTFAAQISAITYPLEFEAYDGFTDEGWSSQPRKTFDFAYRTLLADDEVGSALGYQIHLVFNALAQPVVKDYKTFSGSAEPLLFQWDISTTPVAVPDARPASHLVVDSRLAYPAAMVALEELLYGTIGSQPHFPTMIELLDLFESFAVFRVTDQGNGIATVSGPDSVVYATGPDSAIFSWPSVVQLDEETYSLTSL